MNMSGLFGFGLFELHLSLFIRPVTPAGEWCVVIPTNRNMTRPDPATLILKMKLIQRISSLYMKTHW